MRLLLDSHSLLWAVNDPSRLGTKAVSELRDVGNDLLVSAATIWEIAIKVVLGKLSLSKNYHEWMTQAISDLGATILPITVAYADAQVSLCNHHRDPFDRLLIAQAQVEGIPLVSNDPIFDQYGVVRIW